MNIFRYAVWSSITAGEGIRARLWLPDYIFLCFGRTTIEHRILGSRFADEIGSSLAANRSAANVGIVALSFPSKTLLVHLQAQL